jgi:hypothetical protein
MWQIISSKFTPFVTIRRMVGRNAAYAAQSSRYISTSNYYELIYINIRSCAYKYSGKKPYLLYHHVPIYITPRMTSKIKLLSSMHMRWNGNGWHRGTNGLLDPHFQSHCPAYGLHSTIVCKAAWPKDAERVHNHGYHACCTDRMKAR